MLPQLRMEQTYAQIGLETERGVQEIRQPRAELNMQQQPAELHIKQPLGVLKIDTSEARAQLDLKGILRRSREYASLGRQKALQAIAKISQEGDQMRHIEKKGNKIAQIAAQNDGVYDNTNVIQADWTTDGIEISYQKAEPEINWKVNGVKMNPEIHKPEINYTPGKVDVYVRQKNSLTIDVVGGIFDQGM
ncbi:hypothetical protein EDM56_00450 [Brevibacillus fluminis]|uniref:Uncharacterized protein n=1 Tax=Brevibacillus fluminis TaxID=511487 RepID=A0A3M8DZH3_9BACL|nr:DUF6470 family protein [Brevibacillus fluminis]RNB92651.1 hypothetical protein EDM56_00450 [Brevibacillus fluminis]